MTKSPTPARRAPTAPTSPARVPTAVPMTDRRGHLRWLAALGLGVGVAGLPRPASASEAVRVATVARGLDSPWGLAFLPGDGGMLVTEQRGQLRIVRADGQATPVAGVPEVVARGQGGLLDVALDPDFDREPWVYLSYSERGEDGVGTAVARGRLSIGSAGARLDGVQPIFRQVPKVGGGNHFGSRLVFDRGGRLFVTLGDRAGHREQAQVLDNTIGKVVRIERDGSIPADNPFVGRNDARPEIWSYGHRNPQSAAIHPGSGKLWIVEHGPRGGDEVNIPLKGLNYGWPVIGYGIDYSGARLHETTAKPGMEQPVYYWVPSIAPSGMAFYSGSLFKGWNGNLLVGALAGQALHRLVLDGERIVGEEVLLSDLRERIRDVRVAPDGTVLVLTDSSDGKVLRLVPATP